MAEEENNSKTTQLPYAVPRNMRTRTLIPQILAGILVLGWISILTVSTTTLAKTSSNVKSPLDKLLSAEVSYWGSLVPGSDSVCDSYVSSQLLRSENLESIAGGPKPTLVVELSGASALRYKEERRRLSMSIRLGFNSFRVLESLEAQFRVGESAFIAKTLPDDKTIEGSLEAGRIQSTKRFGTIPAIFLVDRGAGNLSLRFPKELATLIDGASTHMKSLQNYRSLSTTEFDTCQENIRQLEAIPLEALFDVSSYVRLLPARLSQEISKAILSPTITSSINPQDAGHTHD